MSHRPARITTRINPDTVPVLALLLVVLAAIVSASFTLSFAGLSAAAPWAAVAPHLSWLVPVALELAIIGYVGAAYVHLSRGEPARGPWALVWVCTLVSSGLNAGHAWDAGPGSWQGITGAGLAAIFPFLTLAAAHVIARVVFTPAADRDADGVIPSHLVSDGAHALLGGVTQKGHDVAGDFAGSRKKGRHGGTSRIRDDGDRSLDEESLHQVEVLRDAAKKGMRSTHPLPLASVPLRRLRPVPTPAPARRRTPELDAQIIAMSHDGAPVRTIAQHVGLSKSTVSRVLRGREIAADDLFALTDVEAG